MKTLDNARVLVVEDDPVQAFLVQEILEEATGVRALVTNVTRLGDAITALEAGPFDVALLDLGLPDSSGLDSLTRLRRAAPTLPIVVVTGLEDEELGLAALKAGAQDYLVKGHLEPLLLARSLRYAIERCRAEHALARERTLLRTVVNTIPDLIWLKDVDGLFLSANPRFEHFVGRREADLIGRTDFDLVDRELAEFFRANDRLAVEAGGPRVNEEWVTFADDGHRGLLETIKTPLYDDQQRLVGVLGIAREITERARVTEQLRLAAEDMAAAQRLARFGSWELEIDVRTAVERDPMVWSDETYRIFGYEPGEPGPTDELFRRRVPDEDLARIDTAFAQALRERSGYSVDHRVVLPGGEVRHVHEQARVVFDPSTGAPLRVIGIAHDITERVRVTEELRESKARLEAALEGGGIGTWAYDLATDQSWWDESTAKLFGRTLGEVDGGRALHFVDFVHPDDRPRIRAVAERCLRNAEPFSEEFRYLRPDGSEVWFVGRGRLVQGEPGSLPKMMGAIIDVTERRRVEDALVASEARFRQLAEAIREVFWMTSVDKGQMLYVSPAYESIWGRSVSALYADPTEWHRAIHPDDRERVHRAAMEKQAAGTYDEEYRIVRPDGEVRWIRDQAFPVRGPDGEVIRVVGSAEDVTVRRQLEHQMHESQKMESIGVLAGGVAHDFNNLLTVISGNTELLRMEIPDDTEAAGLAQQIGEAAARAANLTRQLLAFSRRDVLDPKLLDVNQVVHELERMLGRLLGEDVVLSADLGAGLGQVYVDPGHLEQVIMNLSVNARDAMPKGGKLTIETRSVTASEALGSGAPTTPAARYVRLRIRDTGSGMPPEVQARIFEPFFTTKARGRGTGLGLAVVHGIIAQSSGRIEVESTAGVGTTFSVYLPEVQTTGASRERGADAPLTAGTERVLVVEDDPSVRSVAARMLARQGYEVALAASAEEALRLAQSSERGFDLVITDVVMPGMDGGELAAELRQRIPHIKVLFTSGFTDDAVVRHGVLHAEVPFLQKPYSVTSLAAKVREVLAAT